MTRPKKPDRDSDLEAWLASNRVDDTADYMTRGRKHSNLPDNKLFEAWKSAVRAMAAQPGAAEHRALHTDLSAEIELRGLKAPREAVREALEKFRSSVGESADRLKRDPDEWGRANDEVQKGLQEQARPRAIEMARPRSNNPIEPMTLGNMRANGVRALDVSCWQCHHRTINPWPDHVPVPTFGPRMVCTRCGIIGADVRPNWQEQPPRESLTGVQWR